VVLLDADRRARPARTTLTMLSGPAASQPWPDKMALDRRGAAVAFRVAFKDNLKDPGSRTPSGKSGIVPTRRPVEVRPGEVSAP
jgi:hypothetical protein